MSHTEHPFLDLLEQHAGAISRICRAFSQGSREDYEDLRQEVIINLWQGWKHYRPDHKTVTWVWHIATNTCITWYRHKRRQIATTTLEDDLALPDVEEQEAALLHSLIEQLPYSDQQLLRLYLDGWNHREIATMLDTTQTNVQTRLYRIRHKLKDLNHERH